MPTIPTSAAPTSSRWHTAVAIGEFESNVEVEDEDSEMTLAMPFVLHACLEHRAEHHGYDEASDMGACMSLLLLLKICMLATTCLVNLERDNMDVVKALLFKPHNASVSGQLGQGPPRRRHVRDARDGRC